MIENRLRKKVYRHPIQLLEIPTPFSIGTENSYLILGDKITLVDTGPKTEKAWKAFIYQLNKIGLRIKEIDQIVVTHQHVDHSGLLQTIKEHHPNVKIFAHPYTIPWIEKNPRFVQQKLEFYRNLFFENGLSQEEIREIEEFYEYLDQFMDPIRIQGVLEDGMKIPGLPDWRVIHSPGHSLGHILLYHAKQGALIAGDHIIGHTSGGAFIEPAIQDGEPRPKSVVEYQHSLQQLRKLPLKRIYSGHGNVIEKPYEVIDKMLRRFEQKKNQIAGFLRNGDYSVSELMRLVYPHRYQTHLALYFAEIIGHLDLLELENKVTLYREGHLVKYHLEEKNQY